MARVVDRYLTKQTISPPFNFQHITHTAKTQLPALETVDEKDLPGEFWSVSAYQRPRRHLNGIRADDLGKKHRQLGIKRGSPSSRPTSPIYTDHNNDRPFIPETIESVVGLSETTFDEARETRFHPDDGIKALQPAKQVLKYPKRFSSLNALNDLQQSDETKREPLGTFYESNSSNSSGEAEIRSVSPVSAVDSTENILDFPVPPKGSPELRKEDIAYRAKQPLPPLPRQKAASKPSQSCLISRSKTSTSNVSLIIPVQQPLSPRSKRSSRSSLSVRKSLTFSSSTALTDATWEDDVDFCYEQAAESTCDFNWDGSSHPKEDLAQKSQDDRSISPYHAYSPTTSNGSGTSLPFSGSSETIAERRRSRAAAAGQGHHKRGSSSVGHRGFLAARKSTTDLNARSTPSPAPLQLLPGSSQTSVLSPVFSVTSPDDEPRQASLTPAKMQFSGLEGTNTFYLSDPESCRNSGSSKHRKSSSYGSHESAARPATVPARETNRWSVASANSLPELMHSRPKSKLIFSKTIISAPLETLPQSPQSDATTIEESTIVPRELQTQPSRSSFVMRRPQTPSDRAVLQAAGKSVQQRGSRPPTPKRLSRFDMTPSGVGVPDAPAAGPEWI